MLARVRKFHRKQDGGRDVGGPPAIVHEINELAKNWKNRLRPWDAFTGHSFSVGSDCSGYGSELCALRLLGLQGKCNLVLMSEKCKSKLALHEVMAQTCDIRRDRCQLTKNIFDRDDAAAPAVDLYIAGYPRPPWSRAGKKKEPEIREG